MGKKTVVRGMAVFFMAGRPMCGWFRQVAARGREGGLGPGACLLPFHMQQNLTGLRKGPQRLRDGSALQG